MHTDTFDVADATEVEAGVHLAQLSAGEKASVQGFRIDPGAAVPEHAHPHEQVGYVHRGELTFELADGETIVVSAGDSSYIPGDEVHAAVNAGDEPVEGVDVFSPPRTDPEWA